MFGSLTRSDFNSTFSLLSYVYLAAYKSKANLGNTLLTLIIVTLIISGADIWSMFIQNKVRLGRIPGMIIIVV
jgi:hypothetical protein